MSTVQNAAFKAMIISLLHRGLEAIRYSIPINPQYAYELTDALHNFPSWIDNGNAFIIKNDVFRALVLILDRERWLHERNEKFIGRNGFGRYNQQIEQMEFALASNGEFLGVLIGNKVYNNQNI